MPADRLGDVPLEDLTAEQMVHLLDRWAMLMEDSGAPPSLVHAMDLLSNGIETDQISQTEAVAALREFMGRFEGLR